MRRFGLMLTLLVAMPLALVGWANPCCDMCGEFELGADLLIWQTTFCAVDEAISLDLRPVPSEVRVFSRRGTWDVGFKVHANYVWDCLSLGLSYTRFASTSAVHASIPSPPNTGEGPVFLEAGFGFHLVPPPEFVQDILLTSRDVKQENIWQNLDLRLTRSLCRSCGSDFYGFGSVRWLKSEQKTKINLSEQNFFDVEPEENAVARQEPIAYSFEGVGFGFGLGMDFDLCWGLKFFGEGEVLADVGTRKHRTINVFLAGPQDFGPPFGPVFIQPKTPDDGTVIPEVDLRVGFSYEYCCGCWSIVGQFGYELNYLWNAEQVNQQDIKAQRDCDDIGFGGPFLGLSARF